MAKRITSGKREREKIRQTRRLDKQRKKEERQSGGSRNFEEMLAYVDENGMLHATPPEPVAREEVDASRIEVSVPRRVGIGRKCAAGGLRSLFRRGEGLRIPAPVPTAGRSIFFISRMLPQRSPKADRVTIRTRTRCARNECRARRYHQRLTIFIYSFR